MCMSRTGAPRLVGREVTQHSFDRRVYSSLRRAPGRGRGPPKEAVALTERIPTHTRGTPPNRLRGLLGCAIERRPEAGFAPRSSRYCSRAAVLSVGEAAQLVRIALIAPHRPASRRFSAAPSFFAGAARARASTNRQVASRALLQNEYRNLRDHRHGHQSYYLSRAREQCSVSSIVFNVSWARVLCVVYCTAQHRRLYATSS